MHMPCTLNILCAESPSQSVQDLKRTYCSMRVLVHSLIVPTVCTFGSFWRCGHSMLCIYHALHLVCAESPNESVQDLHRTHYSIRVLIDPLIGPTVLYICCFSDGRDWPIQSLVLALPILVVSGYVREFCFLSLPLGALVVVREHAALLGQGRSVYLLLLPICMLVSYICR